MGAALSESRKQLPAPTASTPASMRSVAASPSTIRRTTFVNEV
jgi:hypothetical protein